MVRPSATTKQTLFCPHLPLAIYQEVVAHLRQVDGVEATLMPQHATEFDYLQSQVAGLSLDCTAGGTNLAQVEAILGFYAQRYGEWLLLQVSSSPSGFLPSD